jgi:hypothetical protein
MFTEYLEHRRRCPVSQGRLLQVNDVIETGGHIISRVNHGIGYFAIAGFIGIEKGHDMQRGNVKKNGDDKEK